MFNSKIILAKNIRMDRSYHHVVDLSNNDLVAKLSSPEYKVYEGFDYTFIPKEKNVIKVSLPYAEVMKANYIAYQNPDYSGKWFFGWIDNIKMRSDLVTQIEFTVDLFSTWWGYWDQLPCFVTREMVNDDIVGNYTQPEGVETGEYVCDYLDRYNGFDDLAIVLQTTEWVNGSKQLATNYGGIYSAGGAYIIPDIETLVNTLQGLQREQPGDPIIAIYLCPKALIKNTSGSLQFSGQNTPAFLEKYVNRPTSLNGYTPKNKKLLTYPYVYLNVSNNNGSTNTLQYELFRKFDNDDNRCLFHIKGVPTLGCSIKCQPFNYKIDNDQDNEEEGLMCGKFPTLSWSKDMYINYLTSNGVNLAMGLASSVVGAVSGGGAGLVTSAGSILSQIASIYQHSLTPNTARGNTNGGDINTCTQHNTFIFYSMSIKSEYARVIDDYFTMYGYKINRIKKGNLSGRPYFNYLEIGEGESIGFPKKGTNVEVPSQALKDISDMFKSGVTVWHNLDIIGNYNLDNTKK